MHRGRPVAPDTLVDLLWGEDPPAAVSATLQGYVARLRRALEPDRPPRAPSEVLVTQQAGYALVLPDDALDAARFEATVSEAHGRLGSVDGRRGAAGRGAAVALRRPERHARALARTALHRARGGARRAGRAQPARGAAGDGARGPGGGRARPGSPRDGGRRARGAHRDVPAARTALGRCAPWPSPGRAGRPTPSRCSARCASCSPRSSGSSPARSCASCRPRCCGRTRDWRGTRPRRPGLRRRDPRRRRPSSPGRSWAATTSWPPWWGCSSSPRTVRCSRW